MDGEMMDGWTDRWTDGWKDRCSDRWSNGLGSLDRRMDGGLDVCLGRWMFQQLDRQRDGRSYRQQGGWLDGGLPAA